MPTDTLDRTESKSRNISPLGRDDEPSSFSPRAELIQMGSTTPAIATYSGGMVADLGKIADSVWQQVNIRLRNFGFDQSNDQTFDSLNEIAELLMGARGHFDEDAKHFLPEHKKAVFEQFVSAVYEKDNSRTNPMGGNQQDVQGKIFSLAELLGIKKEGRPEQFKEDVRRLEKGVKQEIAKAQGIGLN